MSEQRGDLQDHGGVVPDFLAGGKNYLPVFLADWSKAPPPFYPKGEERPPPAPKPKPSPN